MPTYSDEVNVYNPNAIDDAIGEAATTASKYITSVTSDGIMVVDANKGASSGSITANTTGWHIGGVLEFIRNGVARFWIGLKNQNDTTPTVRIGKAYVANASDNESHMELDYHSLQLIDKEGDTYFHVSDLRDADNVVTLEWVADGNTRKFALVAPSSTSNYSVYVDDVSAATSAINTSEFVLSSTPSSGKVVKAVYPLASAYYNFVRALTFGIHDDSAPPGPLSVRFGYQCIADGPYGQATGYKAHANGVASHAEGERTQARGANAHAQNLYTKASSDSQTALGKYNVEDSSDTYALIVGNGTSDSNRSNALAVRWNGSIECASDTDWTTLNSTIKYRIHHGVCYVVGISTNVTQVATGGTVVGTLPTGARPTIDVEGAATTMGNNCGQWKVGTNGQITVWGFGSATKYWAFTASYPL